jgi:hypothetical protein
MATKNFSCRQSCFSITIKNRELGHVNFEFQLIDPNICEDDKYRKEEAENDSILIIIIQ